MKTIKYRYEYRVTKKNCECFRSEILSDVISRYEQMKSKKPNAAVNIQVRSVRLDKYDVPVYDCRGRIQFGPWEVFR